MNQSGKKQEQKLGAMEKSTTGTTSRNFVLSVVLLELDQTDQAFSDENLTPTEADYAADIVRVLERAFLGGER